MDRPWSKNHLRMGGRRYSAWTCSLVAWNLSRVDLEILEMIFFCTPRSCWSSFGASFKASWRDEMMARRFSSESSPVISIRVATKLSRYVGLT